MAKKYKAKLEIWFMADSSADAATTVRDMNICVHPDTLEVLTEVGCEDLVYDYEFVQRTVSFDPEVEVEEGGWDDLPDGVERIH